MEVAAVRLLLLTGRRKSEVLTLRWSDYCEGLLFLCDGKTGPRTVMSCSTLRQTALLALSDFVPWGPCQELGELRTHRRLMESLGRKPVPPDDN